MINSSSFIKKWRKKKEKIALSINSQIRLDLRIKMKKFKIPFQKTHQRWITLHKKSPYSELFGVISPYSVRMRKNTDQNNSEYGHFSRSDKIETKLISKAHQRIFSVDICLKTKFGPFYRISLNVRVRLSFQH